MLFWVTSAANQNYGYFLTQKNPEKTPDHPHRSNKKPARCELSSIFCSPGHSGIQNDTGIQYHNKKICLKILILMTKYWMIQVS